MSIVLKWLLVAVVVYLGYNWWRRQIAGPKAPHAGQASGTQLTQGCSHCGVHAASLEMVRGQRGVYCCIQHCQAHGDQPAS
jgi:uncharacterized protein